LIGPIFGVTVERLLPNFASTYLDRWQTLMGIIFIMFVMFAPQGVVGLLRVRRPELAEAADDE
jgi:branched-chain amino acid transport system permease protein